MISTRYILVIIENQALVYSEDYVTRTVWLIVVRFLTASLLLHLKRGCASLEIVDNC